jgi:hypothetical protein
VQHIADRLNRPSSEPEIGGETVEAGSPVGQQAASGVTPPVDRRRRRGHWAGIRFTARRSSRSMVRASDLSNAQLARTVRAMAYNYTALDPYRAAVLEEAADRLTVRERP